MRFTTTLALTTLTLTFVGCSQLSRSGAAAMSFDENPFLQSDDQQYVSNTEAPLPDRAPQASATPQGVYRPDQGAQYQYNPQQAQPTTQGANVAWQFDLPAGNAPNQQVAAPPTGRPGSGPSSPASRAEAQVAEYLARKHAPANSGIEQVVHQVPSMETAGTARLDFGAGGPELFEPNPFAGEPASGVVQAEHERATDSNHMPMLSTDDLNVDAVRPKAATQSPHVFPGTHIPIPTGRAMLFNDEMFGKSPAATVSADATIQDTDPQPTFTPPTTHVQPGQVPRPAVGQAIPLLRTGESGTAPVTTQRIPRVEVPSTITPQSPPVIKDSRSDSKWRASRRM